MKEEDGAILGVDFGFKRVGLAICDPNRRLAVGLETLHGLSGRSLARAIRFIARQRNVHSVVIGHPCLFFQPTENDDTFYNVIDGIERLTLALKQMGFEVILWDEACTSSAVLSVRKRWKHITRIGSGSKKEGWVDAAAASLILQSYLDWYNTENT